MFGIGGLAFGCDAGGTGWTRLLDVCYRFGMGKYVLFCLVYWVGYCEVVRWLDRYLYQDVGFLAGWKRSWLVNLLKQTAMEAAAPLDFAVAWVRKILVRVGQDDGRDGGFGEIVMI